MHKSRKGRRYRRKNTRRHFKLRRGGSTVSFHTAKPNSVHSSALASSLAVKNQNAQISTKA